MKHNKQAFTLIENKSHSRMFLSGISTFLRKQRDPRLQISGLVKAFTLIELLVVVLIIGILAAIALPQYQKAVDRTRLSQLIISLNAIGKAQEVFYLANGKYSKDFSELDISFSNNAQDYKITVGTQTYNINYYSKENVLSYAWATDTKVPNITLYFFYSQHHSWPNTYACYAASSDDYANTLCKTISGKKTTDTHAEFGKTSVYLFNSTL